ncbi:AAA family ATPase [Cellulosimicrobium aquatile]|uniref:AAA family ATPase n=1 Tax=Cellulosimicrobium aquatile TaxID=1612203 RepID=UPI0014596800|nr:AAA family ATPase [Cellulosimicrobium aquatile]NMF29245.1 ATP-binding protein [Cellulosimicrobium aquatile]
MKFKVRDSVPSRRDYRASTVYLWPTGWDDWFKFSTSHAVLYVDDKLNPHDLGVTKIGEFGLKGARSSEPAQQGFRAPTLPGQFEALDSLHFSLGQDTSYYTTLTSIGASFRDSFLRAMNDIAYDHDLFARAQGEQVTGVSLLREVPPQTVQSQFSRLARGGARRTGYNFKFSRKQTGADPFRLTFSVDPKSHLPTNIHVLIGRNGVGKSTALNNIAQAVVVADRESRVDADREADLGVRDLTNVVSVSFSAFDAFEPISVPRDRSKGITYHYVGLKKISGSNDDPLGAETKDPGSLSREMTVATRACLRGARKPRWLRALRLLESDPIFASIGLVELFDGDEKEALSRLPATFKKLSSGHKIVLLTITKLVETVQEKSLVLIDEPEAHLHPPLLSALVRALSDLLTNRNGVAIIATHSPVVLQEVPRSCVWKLHRIGRTRSAERPLIETFGENVGTLTDEVFGLEVSATGFHKMLADALAKEGSYEAVLDLLGNQLGTEGRILLRTMATAYARGERVDL